MTWVVPRPLLQFQGACTTQAETGRKMVGVKSGTLPSVALFYQGTNSFLETPEALCLYLIGQNWSPVCIRLIFGSWKMDCVIDLGQSQFILGAGQIAVQTKPSCMDKEGMAVV